MALFSLLATAVASPAQLIYHDDSLNFLSEWILKEPQGLLKSVRVEKRDVKAQFGLAVESNPVVLHKRVYDTAGHLAETVTTDSSIEIRREFVHDPQGRLIEQRDWGGETQISRDVIEYDDQGRKRAAIYYGTMDSITRNDFHYDSNGRLVRQIRKSKFIGKQESEEITLEYDNSGNHVRTTRKSTKDGHETVEVDREWTYDSKNRIIEVNEPWGLKHRLSFEYDGDGRKTAERETLDGVPGWLKTFAYDAAGHLTRCDVFDGGGAGQRWTRTEWETNSHGMPVRGGQTSQAFDRNMIDRRPVEGSAVVQSDHFEFEVEYDHNGNWTKYTVLKNIDELGQTRRVPVRRYFRTIEYLALTKPSAPD